MNEIFEKDVAVDRPVVGAVHSISCGASSYDLTARAATW